MPDRPEPAANKTAEPDLTGRKFGDYRILRRLGRGAMAEVYLAQQRSLRRQVALKFLKRSLASDETYVLRFQNEARSAAALVHANIVQIYEVGQVDGTHFIAQEYVRGMNLGQYLTRHGTLDAPLVVSIMCQVAAALSKAAEHGIVHRDIKPENILLTGQCEVKVADFGLARALDGEAVQLTQVGTTMGTPLYMSPEQAEGKPLDTRSDMYSLGVTCFHMLAGQPPFTGDSPLSVAVQHVKAEAPQLDAIRDDLSPALCGAVEKLMAKDPGQRYQTATELLGDLQALSVEEGGLSSSSIGGSWTTAAVGMTGTSRTEATQRLDTLMKGEADRASRVERSWRVPVTIAASVLVAFLVGVALALVFREPNLLRPGTHTKREGVVRRDTAQEQFLQAQLLDSEEAYLAVSKNFPDQEYYVRLAQLHLARLYLRPDYNAPHQALPLFEQLANLDETQQYFRAAALLGQAQVYHLLQKFSLSQSKLDQLHAQGLTEHLEKTLASEARRLKRRNNQSQR